MLVGKNLIGFLTGDEVYHIVGAEVFLYGDDSLQGYDHLVFGFNFLPWMEAVVAVSAVVLVILLAKIVKQHFPSAY